jgi:hypothetical protein
LLPFLEVVVANTRLLFSQKGFRELPVKGTSAVVAVCALVPLFACGVGLLETLQNSSSGIVKARVCFPSTRNNSV